jgi:hypothetical protein
MELPRAARRSWRSLVPVFLATILLPPFDARGQEAATEQVDRRVELRVVLEDFFAGPTPEEDAGSWWARYIEEGTWRIRRTSDADGDPFGVATRSRVRRLSAEAVSVLTDECGNRWTREWEGPPRAPSASDLVVGAVDGGRAVAFWYQPIRPSLEDPGGPRGEGGCYDPQEVDESQRTELILVPARLAAELEPVSRRPAVRDDGRFLLAVIPWSEWASSEPITRSVRYDDERTRFSARLELEPPFREGDPR